MRGGWKISGRKWTPFGTEDRGSTFPPGDMAIERNGVPFPIANAESTQREA